MPHPHCSSAAVVAAGGDENVAFGAHVQHLLAAHRYRLPELLHDQQRLHRVTLEGAEVDFPEGAAADDLDQIEVALRGHFSLPCAGVVVDERGRGGL